MIVKYNNIDGLITDYFQNHKHHYRYGYRVTDVPQRALNLRTKIHSVLSNINQYLGKTYTNNGRKFIDIDDIATVEYKIIQAKGVLIVKNIYFKNNQTQSTNSNQHNKQQPQQKLQYNPVSQESCGFTKVKSNKGLFNFLNKDKKLVCKQWYQDAKDFKHHQGYTTGKVFDGSLWYWLFSDGRLEKIKNNNQNYYMPENKQLLTHKQLVKKWSNQKLSDLVKFT